MASLYAFGMVTSLEPEASAPIATLQIYCNLVTTLVELDETTTGSIERATPPTSGTPNSIMVPMQSLKTRKQCGLWIKQSLMESLRLVVVAAEIGHPKELLTELVWSMRKNWEAGVVCSRAVRMNVVRVLTVDLRRSVLKSWLNDRVRKFEGEEWCCCCAICLDDFHWNSAVVKLRCRHVFHCGCVRDWLLRKTHCPICRSPVNVRFKFWVHKK